MKFGNAFSLPDHAEMHPLLAQYAHGAAVETLTELDPGNAYTIVLLPNFATILSDTPKGRRLVTTHLSWQGGLLLTVLAGTSHETSWTYIQYGESFTGTATFTATHSGELILTGYLDGAPAPVVHSPVGRDRYTKLAARLVANASTAEWTILRELERFVTYSVESAARVVATEIFGIDPTDTSQNLNPVIDDLTAERLVTELLFGEAGTTSVIRRLIKRCALTAMNEVPLVVYLAKAIFSAAETAVRRDIGDPHIGRKIRRFHRTAGATTFQELVANYRLCYPADELSDRRAAAALTAGRSANVGTVDIGGGLYAENFTAGSA